MLMMTELAIPHRAAMAVPLLVRRQARKNWAILKQTF